jgi:hypothetical protein
MTRRYMFKAGYRSKGNAEEVYVEKFEHGVLYRTAYRTVQYQSFAAVLRLQAGLARPLAWSMRQCVRYTTMVVISPVTN